MYLAQSEITCDITYLEKSLLREVSADSETLATFIGLQ